MVAPRRRRSAVPNVGQRFQMCVFVARGKDVPAFETACFLAAMAACPQSFVRIRGVWRPAGRRASRPLSRGAQAMQETYVKFFPDGAVQYSKL